MIMSDSGSSDREPSIGATAKPECVTSRPVMASSSRLKASMSRSRNHPSEAIRKSRRWAAVRWLSGERSHGIMLRQCSRRICMAP